MLRIVERPRRCSYLPEERASLEITFDPRVTPAVYGELLKRGYRRFGWQLFRPMCEQCRACISMRVLAQEFMPSASDRRVMKLNSHVRCELRPAEVSQAHVALFNRYQAFMHFERGWELQSHSVASYEEAFVGGPRHVGWEWRYYEGERLMGVALMDRVPNAISLVYFFYDPDWRRRSPGHFSILKQLEYAKQQGFDHAYLGYWVEACRSLAYKSRYKPHEVLEGTAGAGQEPEWKRAEFS